VGADPLGNRVGELFPRQRRLGEGVPDRVQDRPQFVLAASDHPQPGALPPAVVGPQCRHVQRQVVGGEQVKGAAHGPGPDQAATLPQRVTDVLGPDAVDPGADLELGGRGDLGVYVA